MTSALIAVLSVPDTPTAAPFVSIDESDVPPCGYALNGLRASGPPFWLQPALGFGETPRLEPASTTSGLNSAPPMSCGAVVPKKGSPESTGIPSMYSWYGVRHAANDSDTADGVRRLT